MKNNLPGTDKKNEYYQALAVSLNQFHVQDVIVKAMKKTKPKMIYEVKE